MATATHLARMHRLLDAEGLPCPPLPERVVGRLRYRKPRWFSTVEGGEWPYLFGLYLERLSRPRVEEELTIALAGHGVNSYGLSYFVALGELRVLLQLAWGGCYMPEDETRARIVEVFGLLHEVWPTLERAFARRRAITPSIIACSDFYGGLIQLGAQRLRLVPRVRPEALAELLHGFVRAAEDR